MNTFSTRSKARSFAQQANSMLGQPMFKAHSTKTDKGWIVGFKSGLLTLKKGV